MMIDLPTTVQARIARIRAGARLDDDLRWLRATAGEVPPGWAIPSGRLVCDCRCRCHHGTCSNPIDLDVMDCAKACRSSHILASECNLDETRKGAGVHV